MQIPLDRFADSARMLVQRGAVVDLQLKIKNMSDRTCSRNVGADLQEIFIKSGAEKI